VWQKITSSKSWGREDWLTYFFISVWSIILDLHTVREVLCCLLESPCCSAEIIFFYSNQRSWISSFMEFWKISLFSLGFTFHALVVLALANTGFFFLPWKENPKLGQYFAIQWMICNFSHCLPHHSPNLIEYNLCCFLLQIYVCFLLFLDCLIIEREFLQVEVGILLGLSSL